MMADACDNKHEGVGVNSSETSAADSGAVEYNMVVVVVLMLMMVVAVQLPMQMLSQLILVAQNVSVLEMVVATLTVAESTSATCHSMRRRMMFEAFFRPSATCGTSALAADFQH